VSFRGKFESSYRRNTQAKQQIEQMQDQLQEAELTFKHQIHVHEKNAQDNWIKAWIWEREVAEESRENTYLKYRLDIMEGKTLPEGYMRQEPMPGRREMQNTPQRDPESGAVP